MLPLVVMLPTFVMFPTIWDPSRLPVIEATELTHLRTPLVTLRALPAGQLFASSQPRGLSGHAGVGRISRCICIQSALVAFTALVALVAVLADPADVAYPAFVADVADPAVVA